MPEISHQQKFLLVSTIPHTVSEADIESDMKELISLVETYGGYVADLILQKREGYESGGYIGRGKIADVAEAVTKNKIDVVVLNSTIKAGQLYDLETTLAAVQPKVQVWDRVDLILKIFSLHASTAEAKLQIELAAMRHMGPRIYGMGTEMSQQGAGIGTVGVGETNTELMKRHFRDAIKKVKDRLDKQTSDRQRQMEKRSDMGLKTVSIVGYTNAGKTTLFNQLAGKTKKVQNALFVTLDSSVGSLYLPNLKKEVMLADTIGFIRDLPVDLIEAFRSTLMESIYADLILHVIDISDPDILRKIEVVEGILDSLKATHNRIYLFNKVDLSSSHVEELKSRFSQFSPQFISVKTGIGLENITSAIEAHLTA